MSKQKKDIKISFLAVEIVSFICLIVGVIGILVCIEKWDQLNLVHLGAILGLSSYIFLFSLIILIVHNVVYLKNKEKMSYIQYNRINSFNSKSDTFAIMGQNSISAIIVIILIILAHIF